MNETKLLRKISHGDQKAFEQIMDQYISYVSYIVYGMLHNSMSAEDIEEVTSDVFFVLWQQADRVEKGKLKAYLGRIARYKALNKLRERQETISLEAEEIVLMSETQLTEEQCLEKEEREVIQKALQSMEIKDKEIFLRHYYYYETVPVIALKMNMTVSAVKARLVRGRKKLKLYIRKGGYFYEAHQLDG